MDTRISQGGLQLQNQGVQSQLTFSKHQIGEAERSTPCMCSRSSPASQPQELSWIISGSFKMNGTCSGIPDVRNGTTPASSNL